MSSLNNSAESTALQQARRLQLPTRDETLRRDPSVYDFWDNNEKVLSEAWKQWNQEEAGKLPKLDHTLINPKLRAAVQAACDNPTPSREDAIKNLWKQVAPGVFAVQFFDLGQLSKLRTWFKATADAGIPIRPPYGITLNRNGVMIDPRSVGHLGAPHFQSFYNLLVDDYVRPVSRLFFPADITRPTDDDESFAFSIEYQGVVGGDKSIRPHSDSSTITFNINLDSTKTWTGSSLIFYNGQEQHEVEWAPGVAVMHLGKSKHAALPIETGTRSNWVIWTMGSARSARPYGAFVMGEDAIYDADEQMTAKQRWEKRTGVSRKLRREERWIPF